MNAINNNNTIDRNDGFVYSITNKEGVQSHIIGTIHIATRAMAQNARLFNLLKGAQTLYTEPGYDITLFGRYSNGLYKDAGDPSTRGYIVDYSLIFEAIKRNIPVRNLDDYEQNPLLGELVHHRREAESIIGPEGLLKGLMQAYDIPEIQRIMRFWKTANVRALEAELGTDVLNTALFAPRNLMWLQGYPKKGKKGLLQIVKETKKPVCIAVGAVHLFGKTGLLKAFEEAGFVVKALPPSNIRSRL